MHLFEHSTHTLYSLHTLIYLCETLCEHEFLYTQYIISYYNINVGYKNINND